ncbi:MAG: crotonase/enoyl-CoA hydratase family protein [Desulfobacterales bacterium]|nr:crotonase/enoyl-CoA hydratase family protein [Desulfobacterales bacterium]
MERVAVDIDGHVLTVGLNRAEKRNAVDPLMFGELGQAFARLEKDPDLRCGLLYAHGEHFTAGLDLMHWAEPLSKGAFPEMPDDALDPLGLDTANRLTKPLVMAVQGTCLTIGIELMLAADIRVAAKNTRFGQIEIKRGLYPVGGATLRLFQEFGWGNAMRYLLTADEFGAAEAYRLGLVQEMVEPGQQFERALEIAQRVAARAPLGVYATLASARLAREQGMEAATARLLPDLMRIMPSEDLQEGLNAFLERREARFSGR